MSVLMIILLITIMVLLMLKLLIVTIPNLNIAYNINITWVIKIMPTTYVIVRMVLQYITVILKYLLRMTKLLL